MHWGLLQHVKEVGDAIDANSADVLFTLFSLPYPRVRRMIEGALADAGISGLTLIRIVIPQDPK